MQKLIFFFSFFLFVNVFFGQEIAVLKYGGGGDWYSNPSALPNLVKFCNQEINTGLQEKIATVTPTEIELFNYPFIHMTGHGNVFFANEEVEKLQSYLLSGGFLHIDDNYGMDQYIRKEILKLFPNNPLVELAGDHPIFNQVYNFQNGLPKIHEHNNGRPQALGITIEGRLVLLYTLESDLGDGWENPEIHNDPPEVRLKALQMGANIIHYVFKN